MDFGGELGGYFSDTTRPSSSWSRPRASSPRTRSSGRRRPRPSTPSVRGSRRRISTGSPARRSRPPATATASSTDRARDRARGRAALPGGGRPHGPGAGHDVLRGAGSTWKAGSGSGSRTSWWSPRTAWSSSTAVPGTSASSLDRAARPRVILPAGRCESGRDAERRRPSEVEPRVKMDTREFDLDKYLRVQARRPFVRGVGPDRRASRHGGRGSLPRVHDGHRDPHGRLPARPPRHPSVVRPGGHRLPLVLGLRGALARRGVQPVPGESGYRVPPTYEDVAGDDPFPTRFDRNQWIRRKLGTKGTCRTWARCSARPCSATSSPST